MKKFVVSLVGIFMMSLMVATVVYADGSDAIDLCVGSHCVQTPADGSD